MVRPAFSCIVVIPVGPGAVPAFLDDTVASVFRFGSSRSKIVLIDNTNDGWPGVRLGRTRRIDILRCPSLPGAKPMYGGLYYNLSSAMRHACEAYDFDVLLRLDDDALLTGSGADAEAIAAFAADPAVGCLGSYRQDCTGKPRDFAPVRRRLRRELSLPGALRHPRRWRLLRQLRRRARANGYEDGEHCLGGAAFYNGACIRALAAQGWLARRELLTSNLGEDHLFGMMVVAAGFKNADFATAGRPLGLAWRGLPACPAELIGMGKKIVHSVKFFGDMDQAAVRAEFRRLLAPDSAHRA